MLLYLRKKQFVTLRLKAFDRSQIKSFFAKGVPSAFQQSIPGISTAFLTALVSTCGLSAIAAYGIIGKLEMILFYPAMALNMVLTSIIGQCVGGKRPDRAKDYLRLSILYGVGFLAVLTVLVVVFARPLSGWFLSGADVADIVVHYFGIVAAGYVLNTATNCFLGGLNGLGKPGRSMNGTLSADFCKNSLRSPADGCTVQRESKKSVEKTICERDAQCYDQTVRSGKRKQKRKCPVKRGYLYIAMTTLLFSSMEIALKFVAGQFNPVQLTFSRFLAGGVVLLPLAVHTLKKRGAGLNAKALASFALLGFLGIAVSMGYSTPEAVMTDSLVAARDPIGIRPLFYGYDRTGAIVFASEAKNLIGLCEEVCPFPPGHYYAYGKFIRYVDITTVGKYSADDLETVCKKIREKLILGVEKRLDADAPLGFLLSGGLDSSLVCAISAKILHKKIRTFAIGMDQDAIDLKYAREAAEFIGADHTEVFMTREEVIATLPEVVALLGTYDITTIRASMGMYLCCKAIHEKTDVRVLLTGEISDELFGYKYTDFAPSAEAFQQEAKKRIDELYLYDVLRADRCISVNSIEARVPFGDLDFVRYVMRANSELRTL